MLGAGSFMFGGYSPLFSTWRQPLWSSIAPAMLLIKNHKSQNRFVERRSVSVELGAEALKLIRCFV